MPDPEMTGSIADRILAVAILIRSCPDIGAIRDEWSRIVHRMEECLECARLIRRRSRKLPQLDALDWLARIVRDHPAFKATTADGPVMQAELLRLVAQIAHGLPAPDGRIDRAEAQSPRHGDTRSFGGSTAMTKRKKLPATLTDQLRECIRQWTEENECSVYELAMQAGIDRTVLYRFVGGERNINLATADRLAAVLKVRLADD
jgi:hypothetical protein